MRVNRRDALRVAGTAVAAAATPGFAQDKPDAVNPLRLWYRQPATAWVEALPVGNGRLGAMVFGGITSDRIQLNEDSFFAGGPYDTNTPDAAAALPEVRRLIFAREFAAAQKLADQKLLGRPVKQMAYQPIGDLLLTFPALEEPRDYVRELDLDGAIARTSFRTGSARHVREVIASAPDGVVAVRLTAEGRGGVTAIIALTTPQAAEVTRDGPDTLVMSGIGPDNQGIAGRIRFETRLKIATDGGTVTARGDSLYVEGAKEVVLMLATATSFRAPDDVSGDPAAATRATLTRLGAKPWRRMLEDHQADYRRLFRGLSIDLGATAAAALPTDERIRRSAELDDPGFAALYAQYGRYLLIASSRPGTQPANLQGIWNEKTTPSWQSKWTLNINTEMNYWLAPMAGLAECGEPLLRMVEELAVTGRKTARGMYGASGWMVHNNTDIFRQTAVVDGAKWALWPTGAAWLLSNLWDAWEYNRDRAYLARIYPLMTEACAFFLDTLQNDPASGKLVTNPSLSPENQHPFGASLCAGPAMDSQLLRDLFDRTIAAGKLLERDAPLRPRLAAARSRLPEDRIGKAGQFQEWMEDWDLQAPEPQHRHVSHLYALYPGQQVDNETTPALAAAARRSLELRGDDATGWSIGWKINLWAKLGDAERTHKILRMLFEPRRTYPNMFDAHPPFQIDGNFGGAAGILQMLVQSHAGRVHLLPALPRAWRTGSVKGVRVRDAGMVDVAWADGRLREAIFRSATGGRYRVRHSGRDLNMSVGRGKAVRLTVGADGGLVRA
ncbi:glycoside hydrolase family 95 protein [Sphingomonas sp. RS2018]